MSKGGEVFRQMEDLRGIFGAVDMSKIKRFNMEGLNKEAQQVDIMELFSEFSEDQIKNILNNNVGFQLTEGCSNYCSFCYKQAEKGISHEFSKSSLKEFFKKYGIFFDRDKVMTFYKASDPFDKDDFGDIYNEFRQYQPEMRIGLTSAVPIGSEEKMINIIGVWESNNENKGVSLRLSVHKHNYDRVNKLLNLASEKVGERVVGKYINLEPRHRGVLSPAGHGMKYKDPTVDVVSPACMDGTIITPKGIFSSCMLVPSKVDTSGERDIKINKDNYQRSVISYCERDNYFGFYDKDSLVKRLGQSSVLLPSMMDSSSKSTFKPYLNVNENVALFVARESYAFGLALAEIEYIYEAQKEYQYPNDLIDKYFELIAKEVDHRKDIMLSTSFDETDEITGADIDFQLEIYGAYFRKLACVLNLKNKCKGNMERFSNIVHQINSMNITQFEEIMGTN